VRRWPPADPSPHRPESHWRPARRTRSPRQRRGLLDVRCSSSTFISRPSTAPTSCARSFLQSVLGRPRGRRSAGHRAMLRTPHHCWPILNQPVRHPLQDSAVKPHHPWPAKVGQCQVHGALIVPHGCFGSLTLFHNAKRCCVLLLSCRRRTGDGSRLAWADPLQNMVPALAVRRPHAVNNEVRRVPVADAGVTQSDYHSASVRDRGTARVPSQQLR